jgi:hypothetical protein
MFAVKSEGAVTGMKPFRESLEHSNREGNRLSEAIFSLSCKATKYISEMNIHTAQENVKRQDANL